MFASDLKLLYIEPHDFLPYSRTSVSTAGRRKRPYADCRSDYTSRLLRDRGVIRWGQTLFSVFDVTGRIVLALFRVHDARPEYLG